MKSPTSINAKKIEILRKISTHCLTIGLCVVFLSQAVVAQSHESKSAINPRSDTISNQGFSIRAQEMEAQPVENTNHEQPVDAQLNGTSNDRSQQNVNPVMNTQVTEQSQDQTSAVKILPKRSSTAVLGHEIQSPTQSVPWYRSGIGALSIVLCVMGGLYWLVRKWVPSIRVADSRAIQVIARTTITPKHQAALIQIGRRFVLVGITGEQMNTLCEVTHPEEIAELTARVGLTQSNRATGFENVLSKETEGFVEPAMDAGMDVLADSDQQVEPRASWLKAPALNELKNKLRSLQHRSS